MKNVSDKSCRENQTHILCSITSFRKSCCLGDNAEEYCRDGQDTDDNMARRMRIACWITNGTDTHTHTHTQNMNYWLLFHGNMVSRTHLNILLILSLPVLLAFFRNQILCLIYDLRDSNTTESPQICIVTSLGWEINKRGPKWIKSFYIFRWCYCCKFSGFYSNECSESFLVFRTVKSLM